MNPDNPPLSRILLVDDNPADRQLVLRELHRDFTDLEIWEAADMEGFERAIATESFDLIVTDYELRWSTGLEVLRQVKALDPMLPVVMFTDSGSQEIAVEAMKAGLDDYVLKSPKHLIRLSQAVRIAWENSQTRRRANELDLRQRFLLDQLAIGIFRASADGQLIEVNEGFLKLLGLDSLAAAKDFFHKNFEFDTVNRLQTGQQQWERRLRRPDGQTIWVQINEALSQQNGKSVIDGLVSDITEKKEAAIAIQQFNAELEARVQERTVQLEASNRQLEETNQELEVLAYSLSHDLRSPIRRISGFVDLLVSELPRANTSPTIQDYLRRIARSARQAGQMIDGLLDYSRTGRVSMQSVRVDMGQLVRYIQQQLIRDQSSRNIQWHIEPLPSVRGDRTLLQRVWQNLMDNAVTYTQPRDPAVITIGSQDEGDRVTFFVQDNGIGFDERYGDRLFSMFQRLHDDGDFQGTGIGLTSARRIIHRHGGQIWATGEEGKGATFYFSLPKL